MVICPSHHTSRHVGHFGNNKSNTVSLLSVCEDVGELSSIQSYTVAH
jgi:hypothetical protein